MSNTEKEKEKAPSVYSTSETTRVNLYFNETVDALTLRWLCPKQTKTTAVLAGVRVREGCETGSKQVRRW